MDQYSHDTLKNPPSYLIKADGAQIAYHKIPGKSPGIVFFGGLASDMTGTKALELQKFALERGQEFLRFDYQGHGASSGDLANGTIGLWLSDCLAILDAKTEGRQILVGSSMGGWLMLLPSIRRSQLVAGLVGIASAPDFTEDLMWARFDQGARNKLLKEGFYLEPSAYSDEPYKITLQLIEDGRNHLVLRDQLRIDAPVRLLHGMADPDVPYQVSINLAENIASPDLEITLIKNGDHRLSANRDLNILKSTIEDVLLFNENMDL